MTERRIARVLDQYALGAVESVRPLQSGYQSDNWLVQTSGGRFVLKRAVVAGADTETVQQLLAWLRAEGVPVPGPIRGRAGRWCVRDSAKGTSAWAVNRFLEGAPLPPPAVDRNLDRIGAALGALHTALVCVSRTHEIELRALGPRPDENLREWFEPWRRSEAHPREAYARFREERRALARDLTSAALNGDLGPHSLLFRGEELSGILDFGAACFWYLLFDLASCAMYVQGFRAERRTAARELVRAYRAAGPLESAELELLPLFARCRALVQVGYFDMRLRAGVTQGNDEASNRRGFANGLDLLQQAERLSPDHFLG